MNVRLRKIQNWSELARLANWSVKNMAERIGVSKRTLRRRFLEHFGKTTGCWLAEQRQKLAVELLEGGSTIKEATYQLGYKHTQTFSREFKKRWGICPKEWLVQPTTSRPKVNVAG